MASTAKKLGRPLSIPEPKIRVLNESDSDKKCDMTSVEVSKELQKLMLRMKGSVISEDGTGVQYSQMKTTPLFTQYKQLASYLRKVDVGKMDEKEKLAFFINVYNALTIHGLVECEQLPTSVLNVQLFWKVTSYNIGGHVYSLDDIEHGVLRVNRPHPASKDPPFSQTDPRLPFIMKHRDPRIHFALVCGAKSCPVIRVYTAANVDEALDSATRNFCDQEVKPYEIQRQIKVSKIFQWYRVDFGDNDIDALRWTVPFLDEKKAMSLRQLIRLLEEQGMVDLCYTEYDWNLNSM